MHIAGVTHVTEFSPRIVHYYVCSEGNTIACAPAGNVIPYAPEGRHSLAQRVSAGSVNGSQRPARAALTEDKFGVESKTGFPQQGQKLFFKSALLHDALLDFECMPSQRILAMRLR